MSSEKSSQELHQERMERIYEDDRRRVERGEMSTDELRAWSLFLRDRVVILTPSSKR